MESSCPCPVCLGTRSISFIFVDNHRLLTCSECGTVYIDPLPTAEQVQVFYRDSYNGSTTGYFTKVEKKLRRSRGRMRQLAKYARGGKFLDVGCNGGFMAEAAREAGFDAVGLDIDAVSIGYAREHYPANDYFIGTVEAFTDQNSDHFDLIYSSEVIEHIPDVRSFCWAISSLLKPNGILFVTTPDITHWRRPSDVRQWDAFCPPDHCIYFTPSSLIRLFNDFNLTLVKRKLAFKPGIKLIFRKVIAV
jgi:SAM-dependent methyltransferase